MHKKNNKQKGYTIIETMIAVSLFLIIVTTGMGALLNANLLHQKSRDMRSIIDNLSFIMEDMSRNLRTGYNYHCIDSGSANGMLNNITSPKSSSISNGQPNSCWGIAFKPAKPATGGSQWGYEFISENNGPVYIIRSTDGGTTWVQLTSEEIDIDVASGFTVLGAESSASGDSRQPFVEIKLSGTITFKNVVTPFSLQTSVSQRALDN